MPDSSTLKYSYNKFGQLSSIHLQQANSTVSTAQPLVTLTYDSQGNIQTQQFGNTVTLTQQFDVFNRLTQQQLTYPAQALFDTCTYNYDSVNQLIARKEEGVSSHNINFEYNSLGQLIQQNLASSEVDTTTQYQWDSFGNPVSQSTVQNNELAEQQHTQPSDNSDAINKVESNQSANTPSVIHSEYSDSKSATVASDLSEDDGIIQSTTDADRLTHFGDSDFHYDEFGNQIRETGKGIKTRREYNAFNQLSCFNNNGTLTQYDYDPLGRRIAKHTEQGKIDYIWDNDQLIGEYQHGEYTWYINLPNQFHPVALIKQGEVYYYHLDQLNTPRFVTNNKAEVVWENQADVYGYEELKAESELNKENSFTQPIRFQGQYLDEESGLHYNRYRYYSPKQQRFINQDPIGLVGGINHYQYAPNPVNWVDPFGLSCKEGSPTDNLVPVIGASGKIVEHISRDTKLVRFESPLESTPMTPHESPYFDVSKAMEYGLKPDYYQALFTASESNLEKLTNLRKGQGYFDDGVVLKQATVGELLDKNPDAKVLADFRFNGSVLGKESGGYIVVNTKPPKPKRKDINDPSFAHLNGLNHKKAAVGEYNAHQLMLEKGYKPLGSTNGEYKPGQTGIDGIYENPNPLPDHVITEAKYNKARLGKTIDGKQMSDPWVTDKRLKKAGLSKIERDNILESLEDEDGAVQKLLIHNKPDGSLIVKELGKNAQVVGNPFGL